MTILKLTLIFLSIVFYSCVQKTIKQPPDPAAVKLNNKIVELAAFIDNMDSCRKALAYLDSATSIDSNYFLGYYNKLMFLYPLKDYKKAILTIDNCIRIKPGVHDLYLTRGILYEKTGDTTASRKNFQKSLEILNPVLDTMNVNNSYFERLTINKAINLVMLGDDKTGYQLLRSMYDQQKEPEFKEMILSFMKKSKKDLIETMTSNPQKR